MAVILASVAFWTSVTFARVGDDDKPEVLKFRARFKRLKKSERVALNHRVAAMGMTAEVRQSIQKLIDDPATDAHQRDFWKARLDAKTMTDAELLNEVLVDWELRDSKDQFVAYTPAARAELEEDLDGIETSLVKAYFDAVNKPVTAEEVEKNSEAQPVITS
ncbi:hypothetical protein [Comamonas thiooxydans]|uniref:hypothetical protein n=1 Tax=Comamonas thiooxydans TaxID=363952 RepID=UPI000B41976B|nr:hypothetical protein [Comamonas thiooxydans]